MRRVVTGLACAGARLSDRFGAISRTGNARARCGSTFQWDSTSDVPPSWRVAVHCNAARCAHGASVAHIRYAGEDIELHIASAALRVSPLSLLRVKPRIIGLRAAEIAIVTKPGEPRGRP